MSVVRRLAVGVSTLSLAAVGVVGFGQSPASAAPDFQVPFQCGVTVTAATFGGHNPANSVDFQKDGITGMPVLASSSGTVSRVANEGDTSYGRWIEIDHGSGWTTRYAHLSKQDVSEGQRVTVGTKIGEAGATGGVSGPHLHFEERSGGTAVKVTLHGKDVPYNGHTDFTSKNNC